MYKKARCEEVVPGMRAAVSKACAVLDGTSFVEDLNRDVRASGDEMLSSEEGSFMRIWFHRFCTLRGNLAPMVALPIRGNFWSLLGRRMTLLNLSDSQRRVALSWGADFRAALKVYHSTDPQGAVYFGGRDSAVESSSEKRFRPS